MAKRKIILDVDTGSDDAVAIIAAVLSPDIQLEAICTTQGNRDIDTTTENTLRVVELLKADVPVYRGCRAPIAKKLCPDLRLGPRRFGQEINCEVEVEGKMVGMHSDFETIPAATIHEQEITAPEFYVQYLRNATEPVTLVTTGPMTNVAVAIMMDPRILKNIEQIVSMAGGYLIGNGTPRGEGNVLMDPEACQILLNAGVKMTMVPLDATHEAYITLDDCKRFRALGTVAGNFAADQIEQRILIHNAFQPLGEPDAAAVHDPLCIAYLIDPEVLRDVRHVYCVVGFSDYCEGQTIIDERYYTEKPNCYFAFHGDRHKFAAILEDLFARSEKVTETEGK